MTLIMIFVEPQSLQSQILIRIRSRCMVKNKISSLVTTTDGTKNGLILIQDFMESKTQI